MNKIKKIQILRVIIQIITLFILPGLFIMAFSELKEIVKMLLSGNINFFQAISSLMEFIGVTIITILLGRFFCGWLCAFGTYNDIIHYASTKLFKIKFKINERADSYLKYVKYIVLLAILTVSCVAGSTVLSSASPWDAFSQITSFSNVIVNLPFGILLLVLITIGAFFIERFFCRYLCPLGAFFNIISRINFLKIRKPSDNCGKCRICTNNCSMGLKLYKMESICGGDCINCLKCIEVCPRKNTRVNTFGQDMNPTLAGSIAIAACVGIYGAGSVSGYITSQDSKGTFYQSVKSLNESAQKYKDGTYTGTGTGFRGGTTEISLTVSSGKISSINTISHEDTPRFYDRVFDSEVNNIISSQSTDIDTISGATYSCEGIISAVKDALSKAV